MWHDVKQNTDEWYALRAGKITASGLNKVMANFGKPFGEPAKGYAIEIAINQISGCVQESTYSNSHMDRGHIEEPLARIAYEEEYFCDVTNGGFFCDGATGTSPDGLVGDEGVIEIKSAIPSVHFARIAKQSFDATYRWQLVGHLKFTGREWVDFISYCSAFPDDKKLYVFRVTSDDFKKEFELVDERIGEFMDLVEKSKHIILNSEYSIIKKEELLNLPG